MLRLLRIDNGLVPDYSNVLVLFGHQVLLPDCFPIDDVLVPDYTFIVFHSCVYYCTPVSTTLLVDFYSCT